MSGGRKPAPAELERIRQWERDNPEQDDAFFDTGPEIYDAAHLIGDFIKKPLTGAQRRFALEIVEECHARNLGSEETAIQVLRSLQAYREFYRARGKAASDAKEAWLRAIAALVRSPICDREKPMSQHQAIRAAALALRDVEASGRTGRNGFSHLKTVWTTNKVAARLPSESAIRRSLREFLDTLAESPKRRF